MANIFSIFAKKTVVVPVGAKQPSVAGPKKERRPLFVLPVSFGVKDQLLFAKRLSFLIKSNVPILESLHILREQAHGASAARVYDRMIVDIANGQYLHASMKRFGRMFGHFAVHIIRVGELSGILSQNLIYLANELEKRHELRRKILGAMVYPIIITVATLGITSLLTVYIFPKIMPIFASLNVDLPVTTKILLAVSGYLQNFGLLTLGISIIGLIGFTALLRLSPPVRYAFHYALLKTPVVGSIMVAYNMANFTRTLGLLLKSGLKVTDALQITADTMENLVYQTEIRVLSKAAERGEQLSRALAKRKGHFPTMATHMCAIGEKTGSLSDTLVYLSEMYEGELNDATKNLSSILEPILMLVMGVIVGFVAVSVITPIYEITQKFSR